MKQVREKASNLPQQKYIQLHFYALFRLFFHFFYLFKITPQNADEREKNVYIYIGKQDEEKRKTHTQIINVHNMYMYMN